MIARPNPFRFLYRKVPPSFFQRLLALALVGCAVPPSAPSLPPAAAPPSTGSQPPQTYKVSFAYEPSFVLLLRRNGEPHTGPATLGVLRFEGGRNIPVAIPLSFSEGRALIPPSLLGRLRIAGGFRLKIGDRDLPLLTSESLNPFWCAWRLYLFERLDPSTTPVPPEVLPPEYCDHSGKEALRKLHEDKQKRFSELWSNLDDPTIEKLATTEKEMGDAICESLINALGPSPPSERALRIVPRCLDWFDFKDRADLREVHARQTLPAEFKKIKKSADSEEMRLFHERYCRIDPKKAREIRLLAAQKFGPKNLGAWLRLSHFIEGSSSLRPSLCQINEHTVEITYRFRHSHSAQEAIDQLNETFRIEKVIEQETHKRVQEVKFCRINHWYLDPPEFGPPPAECNH